MMLTSLRSWRLLGKSTNDERRTTNDDEFDPCCWRRAVVTTPLLSCDSHKLIRKHDRVSHRRIAVESGSQRCLLHKAAANADYRDERAARDVTRRQQKGCHISACPFVSPLYELPARYNDRYAEQIYTEETEVGIPNEVVGAAKRLTTGGSRFNVEAWRGAPRRALRQGQGHVRGQQPPGGSAPRACL